MTTLASGEWTAGPIATVLAAVVAAALALLTGAVTGVFALVRFVKERQDARVEQGRGREEQADRRRSEGWAQLQWAIDTAMQGDRVRRRVGLNAARLLIELPWVDEADKMRALALARAVLGK
ncbi:hypothetical protein SAMN05660766_0590 [Curtobacterium sp. 314Chir4.1]|nr:hypothetical protein SAMN05660766_0590 [Curtobacterium sp. 314Chir4.1]